MSSAFDLALQSAEELKRTMAKVSSGILYPTDSKSYIQSVRDLRHFLSHSDHTNDVLSSIVGMVLDYGIVGHLVETLALNEN